MDSIPRIQKITATLLEEALQTTRKRGEQYGKEETQGDIFQDTAEIASAISGNMHEADDVHVMFIAMKLARYKNQLDKPDAEQDNEVIKDSIIDAIVYIALMEAGRLTRNEQERQTSTTPEDVQPRDGHPMQGRVQSC